MAPLRIHACAFVLCLARVIWWSMSLSTLRCLCFILLGALTLPVPSSAETFAPLGNDLPPDDYESLWDDWDARAEPLETEVLHSWEEDGVRLRVVRFRVAVFKGTVARLAGVYGVPADWESDDSPLPGLLQIHGGGQYADHRACVTGAKRGYAVLSIAWAGRISAPDYRVSPSEVALFWSGQVDAPEYRITTDWGAVDGYHAPSRNPGNAFPSVRPAEWTLDEKESPRNSGWFLCAVAARRALTFLEQQAEVDSERLGVYGHSMGGKLTVMTAPDERVKAAVPSCGGISDRDNDSDLYRKTLDDSVYLSRITCPILFQSPTNDFHGRIGDLPAAINEIQTSQWRVTCSPHHNHQDTPEFEVASLLWFDQVLKREHVLPATPRLTVRLDTPDRIPQAEVRIDDSKNAISVEVFYTEQARSAETPSDRDHTVHRFWHSATMTSKDGMYLGKLPLLSNDNLVWVIANVTYRLPQAVEGAGYYYRTYTTDRYQLSSALETLTPESLKVAGVQTTRQPSRLIEGFADDWQRSWFRYRETPWSWMTNKLHDPTWRAPQDAVLEFEVHSDKSNQLIILLDAHAAMVDLVGGDWEHVRLRPRDFQNHAGESLASWESVRQLKFSPAEHLRPNRGSKDPPRKVGGVWKGTEPSFRELRWGDRN